MNYHPVFFAKLFYVFVFDIIWEQGLLYFKIGLTPNIQTADFGFGAPFEL